MSVPGKLARRVCSSTLSCARVLALVTQLEEGNMKRVVLWLALLACAQARADVETWQFQGASLVAVPGDYAVLAGQVGTLNGYFDYDTTTHSITAFEFTAGPALFSSNNSQVAFCPIGTCTGNALVPAPNKLVFDEELTPAT